MQLLNKITTDVKRDWHYYGRTNRQIDWRVSDYSWEHDYCRVDKKPAFKCHNKWLKTKIIQHVPIF